MGGKGSGRLSTTLMPKDPQKAMELAEKVVLSVLENGGKGIDDKKYDLASKIYLKRVPMMTEEVGEGMTQNIINVIKNHAEPNRDKRAQLGVQREADTGT